MRKTSLKNQKTLKKWAKIVLDWLFPIECLGCGSPREWLCRDCEAKIRVRENDICPVCKNPSIFGRVHDKCARKTRLKGIVIATDWQNELLDKIIHAYKYNFVRDLSQVLARIISEKLVEIEEEVGFGELVGGDVVLVPVPLHRRRENWRGFNQADLLAGAIASAHNYKINSDFLIRRKYTRPQAKKKRSRRLHDLKGAFQVLPDKGPDKNKAIVLVDDVMTTGTTLEECARVLCQSGYKNIWGLAVARG